MSKTTTPARGATSAPSLAQRIADLAAKPLPMAAFMLLLAFVLYGNTLGHQYALDDAIVITQNGYTQKGFAGLDDIFSSDAFEAFFQGKRDLVAGGRYRPLSIATFAIEHQFVGMNPFVSHLVNILLYGLLGFVLHLSLRAMLMPGSRNGNPWPALLAFLSTVLFMAHPIHTEVVANIKGRDEILAMLLSTTGLWLLLAHGKSRYPLAALGAGLAFFLGALSKETALPYLAIIPLALWIQGGATVTDHVKAILPAALGLGAYIALRVSIVGMFSSVESTEILNDPFVGAGFAEQSATAAKTLVLYLGKLFVPATLSHDYYFNQVPVVGWGDPLALLGLAVSLALMGYGAVLLYKKQHVAGFGILFFFISFSIVSNLVFPIGTTMGERFMFVPSLGFILAVLAGIEAAGRYLKADGRTWALYAALGVSAAFGIRTIVRNPVWKNDFVLFTTDVNNSPNSAKMQTAAGGALMDEAVKPGNESKKTEYLSRSIQHLRRAVEIYPSHGTAWLILGNANFNLGQYGEALKAYQQVIRHRPTMIDANKNAGLAAFNAKDYTTAEAYFDAYLRAKPEDTDVWRSRGDNFEAAGKADDAIRCYQAMLDRNPKDNIALGKIGMVHGKLRQDYAQAVAYLDRAIALNPKEEMHHENIGIAYAMSGNPTMALESFNRGLQYFPNSSKLLRNIGITYMNMGDSAKAREYITRAGG